MDTQWFLTRNGETIAQYSTDQFKRAVARRMLRPTDYVRRSDSSTPISAAEFLPATYRPRSAVPRVLGGIVAVVAAVGGIGYGVGAVAPAYLQAAFQNFDKLKSAPQSAIRQATLRQILLSDTTSGGFFLKLSQKDPEAYEALISQFADSLATESADEVLPKVRAYIGKTIIEPRSRNLMDDDKAAMLALNRDMSLQLAATNPKLCIAHALGKPFGDMRPFITPELKAREEQMMLRLLDAEPQTFDLLPAKDLQALNTKVGTGLYEKHGDEIGLLDLENVPDGKEEAACKMFAAYLDGVLTLPETERIALVRAMMLEPDLLTVTATQETTAPEATAGDVPAPPTATQGMPTAPAEAAAAAPSDADTSTGSVAAPADEAKSAEPEADPDGAQQAPRRN